VKLVRRSYWWLPAVLVAAGLGYVGYRVTHPPWKDTEACRKYRQIEEGMSYSRLRIAFGEPSYEEGAGLTNPDLHPAIARWNVGGGLVGARFDFYSQVDRKWAVIEGREFSEDLDEATWWDRLRTRRSW
jgi:hypothetical protein